MSYYKQQEFDFVNRTKKIIQQYDNLIVSNEEEKYEVTLFLNCMVGLLILPQQKWFDNYPTDLVSEEKWGVDLNHITMIRGNQKTVKEVARHLRNSVAHYRFTAFHDSKDKINSIQFRDYTNETEKTFDAIIPLENLRNFVDKLTDNLISQMKQAKGK